MADSLVTDVFKFIAVRPPQLASDSDTADTFIRDNRSNTVDGQKQLTQLGRAFAKRELALQRWKELDLSRLQPFVGVLGRLLRLYENLADNETLPPLADALQTAGLDVRGTDIAELTEFSWNVLYTAYATGPDAGARLDTPMAALRVLHFIKLYPDAQEAAPPDARQSLVVLAARPLVPAQLYEVLDPGKGDTKPSVSPISVHEPTSAMHVLLDELAGAQDLLDRARNAPPLQIPEISGNSVPSTAPVAELRGEGIQSIRLSTIPKLRDVMPSEFSSTQKNLLSNLSLTAETAAPLAVLALQQKVTALTNQAMTMSGDIAFHGLLANTPIDNPAIEALKQLFGLAPQPLPDYGAGSSPDVDMTGRIRPLGIGDLKVVKQKLLAYLPGEVAHIENVLKGESKERIYRTLDRQESTLVESQETVEDKERDTQSTDRFELKKESDATIKEDMSVQAGVTVTGSYGPVTITAHGDFAYATSKEESTKASSNFGRDVVDRSISKIQKTVKTERTTRTFHETEETDTHGVDNKIGTEHVIGVYRWVDKKYRAQIYNYGRRLMLEFVVPEPAAFFQASQMGQAQPPVDAVEPAPFVDAANKPLTPAAFTPATYLQFTSRYNAAGVVAPPQEWIYVSTAFEQNSIDNGHTLSKSVKDVVVPEGYRMFYYDAQVTVLWTNYPQFSLQIGDNTHYLLKNSGAVNGQAFEAGTPAVYSGAHAEGVLPVSVVGYDINAYAVNVSALCSYMPVVYIKWQQDMYDNTFTAYKAMKTEYDQKVRQAQAQAGGVQIEGRNPGMNQDIIARELKKHCLTMLTGMHFNNFHAMTAPTDQPVHIPEIEPYTALQEGRFSQFFEQAFEWTQITYLFYPYFWGRKSRWIELSNQSDPDPAFLQFLQAGTARIVVPVSRAYNDAIAYFLQSKALSVADKIWQGGGVPTIDDPLYKSIADELRAQTDDLAGAIPEGDPWEFTVPTTLVWLQPDSSLPAFP